MLRQEADRPETEATDQAPLEQYLENLREINMQLQKDDIRMHEALKLYRTGARIAKKAEQLLEQYRSEIEIIDLEGEEDT